MRRISFLALVIVLFITSCQKTSVQPSSNVVASASAEDNSVSGKSRTDLLCAYTWMYYRYYIGYVDPNNLGTLAYRRGRHNNTLDLDNDLVTYYPDGTGDESVNGSHIYNTWHFQDSAQTIIVVTNNTGTYTTTILRLNEKTFMFEYTDIYGVNRAGQYVPFSN